MDDGLNNLSNHEQMDLLRNIYLLIPMLTIGCTARGYSGPALPAGESSTISIHTTGKISLEKTVVDRLRVTADTIEVAPGTNTVEAAYRISEREDCSPSDYYCIATEERGTCKATVYSKPGRSYLVTIENKSGYVSARVAGKGYFDFSERADEPNPGAATCEKTSGGTIRY